MPPKGGGDPPYNLAPNYTRAAAAGYDALFNHVVCSPHGPHTAYAAQLYLTTLKKLVLDHAQSQGAGLSALRSSDVREQVRGLRLALKSLAGARIVQYISTPWTRCAGGPRRTAARPPKSERSAPPRGTPAPWPGSHRGRASSEGPEMSGSGPHAHGEAACASEQEGRCQPGPAAEASTAGRSPSAP